MILKSYELSNLNHHKYKMFLFYGENNGFKNEILKNNFKDKYKGQDLNFDEATILKEPEIFFNEVLNKSFFESEKLIIISNASDKIKKLIEELLEKDLQGICLIFVSDKLDKKSKIRSLFEKENNLACIPFYPDNFQSLSSIATNFFKKINVNVSREIINLLIDRCSGNRENLRNELNKLENYTLKKKKITLDEVIKLTDLSENNNISELVDNCLAKKEKILINMINENNFSKDDVILILRTFLIKTKKLFKIKESIKNNDIDDAISKFKPPIFWKDKELVKLQLKKMSLDNIRNLIKKINKTELIIKKNYDNSLNILLDFIFTEAKEINN